jgi:DNA-binding PadR family transcriptional regulator
MPRIPHTSPQTLRLFEALLLEPTRWRYGYDLSRETGLASGTLYPILMRLAAQRLLDTDWEASTEPGRPPRHTYRLTTDGLALARDRVTARTAASGEAAGQARRRAGPAVQARVAGLFRSARAFGPVDAFPSGTASASQATGSAS